MRPSVIATILLALGPSLRAQGSRACEPQASRPLQLRPLPVQAGNYRLTLVATEGPKKGARTAGQLALWRTTAEDRSSSGERAVQTDTLRQPLYGAVQLAFDSVAAPVGPETAEAPDPSSRDPVHPGVLVFVDRPPSDSTRAAIVLTIATVSNRRDGVEVLDGTGIGLWVDRGDETGFTGRWKEWGLLKGGRGYFCARRVGP